MVESLGITHLLMSVLCACGAEVLIEVVEHRAALGYPLLVLSVGGANPGDQVGDAVCLFAGELRVLQVDVVHDLRNGLQSRICDGSLFQEDFEAYVRA